MIFASKKVSGFRGFFDTYWFEDFKFNYSPRPPSFVIASTCKYGERWNWSRIETSRRNSPLTFFVCIMVNYTFLFSLFNFCRVFEFPTAFSAFLQTDFSRTRHCSIGTRMEMILIVKLPVSPTFLADIRLRHICSHLEYPRCRGRCFFLLS